MRGAWLLWAVVAASVSGCGARRADPPDAGALKLKPLPPPPAGWAQLSREAEQGKPESLLSRLEERLAAARRKSDAPETVRAVLALAQARCQAEAMEDGLRLVAREPLPADETLRLALLLGRARVLLACLDEGGLAIGLRERLTQPSEDPATWTADEIIDRALASVDEVWQRRGALSAIPPTVLSDLVEEGDFPAEARGSLRDLVAYTAAEILVGEQRWGTTDLRDLWRLDFGLLLGDRLGSLPPTDRSRHPLARLASVLADLEQWHAAAGRVEGAAEARRRRLVHLRTAATDRADIQRIEDDLDARRVQARGRPWSAMLTWQLAQWRLDGGDRRRAHELARDCSRAPAGSHGARLCGALLREIEAPDLTIAAMVNDAPGKRSVLLHHRNLSAVHLRAYRLPIEDRARRAEYVWPERDEVRRMIVEQKPVAAWKVDLPATGDFATHATFVVPPLRDLGAYVIVASASDGFETARNLLVSTNLTLSDLALVARPGEKGGLEVVAVSAGIGAPRPGVDVSLVEEGDPPRRVFETRVTDADGTARFAPRRDGSATLLGRQGADMVFSGGGHSLDPAPRAVPVQRTLFYTDRSHYRPGQVIRWKVLAFRGDQLTGRLSLAPRTRLTIRLHDAAGEEVAKRSATTNGFGTASGEFPVPDGRLLGAWEVSSDWSGAAWVRVEEYKRPTFEVTLRPPEGSPRLGQPVAVFGEARYLFGLPLTEGKVRWHAERVPAFPSRRAGGRDRKTSRASGETTVGSDGKFRIDLGADADPRLARVPGARLVSTLDVSVTDAGGETREARLTVTLAASSVAIQIDDEQGFHVAGKPLRLTTRRTSLDGAPRPGEGAWRLVGLRPPAAPTMPADRPVEPPAKGDVTEGDRLRPRWSQDYDPDSEISGLAEGDVVARGKLSHGSDGRAQVDLPALPAGVYRLRCETVDDAGSRAEAAQDLVIAAPRGPPPVRLPALLLLERATVHVGEVARLLAVTGFPGQPLFLEISRGGSPPERRLLTGGEGQQVFALPVGLDDRGGIGVTLWFVRDHQPIVLERHIDVPWDDRRLAVDVATFRDRLSPGQQETWQVVVRDRPGKSAEVAAAEVLAYMYDRSLDALGEHRPPDPGDIFPERGETDTPDVGLGESDGQTLSVPAPPRPEPPPTPMRFRLPLDGPLSAQSSLLRSVFGQHVSLGTSVESLGRLGYGRGGGHRAPLYALKGPKENDLAMARMLADEARRGAAAGRSVPAGVVVPLRRNFDETAFWRPHLLTDDQGRAAIEFTVPDSVTGWSFWAHALTRDLRSGSLRRDALTVKPLMVRPYLPRFLREGDHAEIRVVVDSAAETSLSGTVTLEVVDPDTDRSLLAAFGVTQPGRPFTVAAGKSAVVTFPLVVPRRSGPVAVRATGRAPGVSDGESRLLPILPGRARVAESQVVTLRDEKERTLTLLGLARSEDSTRTTDQLVVTLDGNLFALVLRALPYLVEYPYECTEQTLNRFAATAILESLFRRHPEAARLGKELARRETRLEPWRADPNRRMALEETPWAAEARGGRSPEDLPLRRVLDPRVVEANRRESLDRLRELQRDDGSFPWFAGGPPSPHMTLYVLGGIARAAAMGLPLPEHLVAKAWEWAVAQHRRENRPRLGRDDLPLDDLVHLLHVSASLDALRDRRAPSLTADERREIVAHLAPRWRRLDRVPRLMLALALHRQGDPLARAVLDSVMAEGKATPERGFSWPVTKRPWTWQQDTVEGHALALTALLTISPGDPRRHDLVTWLLLDRKLGHWKSTRATAEVIHALALYLQREGGLLRREEVTVSVGAQRTTFVLDPASLDGRAQVVLLGESVRPDASSIKVTRERPAPLIVSATWHHASDRPTPTLGELFRLDRRYHRRELRAGGPVLTPLEPGAKIAVGDEIEVELVLRVGHPAEFVHLRDPRPAGLEPGLAPSGHVVDGGLSLYREVRDSATSFFLERLPAGEHRLRYRLRAATAGEFKAAPATLQSMYAPEFAAHSSAGWLRIDAR